MIQQPIVHLPSRCYGKGNLLPKNVEYWMGKYFTHLQARHIDNVDRNTGMLEFAFFPTQDIP